MDFGLQIFCEGGEKFDKNPQSAIENPKLAEEGEMKEIMGELVVKGKKFALVVSRFNELVSKQMLAGAQDSLVRHGVKDNEVTVAWVPGSFEIPLTAQALVRSKKYDAVICLGTVIRGDTPHFEYVAGEVSKGVAQVSLQSGVPVIFGVLTVDTIEQALERAGTKAGNRGRQAVESAIEMVNLLGKIKK